MEKLHLRTAMALHARPLDRFVRAARRFDAQITVRCGEKVADGKNVMQLLLLAVSKDQVITLEVQGEDEAAAVAALAPLLESDAPQPPAEDLTSPEVDSMPPGRIIGLAQWDQLIKLSPRPLGSSAEEGQLLREGLTSAMKATEALITDEDPFSDIFRAQLTLMQDPTLIPEMLTYVGRGKRAEEALLASFAALERSFAALGEGFAAQRHADVVDVRDRILDSLGHPDQEGGQESRQPVILILEEATPSRVASLDKERVAGVVSLRGGSTSHAAIVARGRGIPLFFLAASELAGISGGDAIQIDLSSGAITPYSGEVPALTPRFQPRSDASGGAQLEEGEAIKIRVNLGAPGDLELAKSLQCDGCGVLRTELLFARHGEAPSVDEQADAYERLGRAFAPHPVIVRLFDASSDKPLAFLAGKPHEANPALGHCGLRLLRANPSILRTQLAAIEQARERSGYDLRALVPMVVDPADVAAVAAEAGPQAVPLGAMIETPAAAVLAAGIARQAAFLSIGTNDLSQYVLASDRHGTALKLGLHPAVLRMIAGVVAAAEAARIECSICGELAGDPLVAPLLVGLGVRVLSVAPAQVSLVRQAVAGRPRESLRQLARRALEFDDADTLQHFIERST